MIKEKSYLRVIFILSALVCLFAIVIYPRGGKEGLAEKVAGKMAEWLPGELKKANIPGAAVAVVDDENIVWQKNYGHIHGPGSRSVDPHTLFCVRSVSKSFTALAVLMAVQDGLVDLDTPIKEYLPNFTVNTRFGPHPEKRITLRNMLAHRAGFSHDPPLGNHFEDSNYFRRYIESISHTWLRFPVGYRFSYSNYGYDLAAYILQVRSGKPFARYLKEKVLDPVGMTDSSFDLEWVLGRKNRARGHSVGSGSVPLRFPEIPSAGLYSNIRDMSRYVQFHLNGGIVNGRRILRVDLMEMCHSILLALPGQRTGYGFGLVREVTGNTFSLYHQGGGRGFQGLMILYPKLEYGVVILTNLYEHQVVGIQARLIINGPVFERYGRNPAAEPGTGKMVKLKPNAPRIHSILGRYGERGGYLIRYKNGKPGIYPGSKEFYPLTFYENDGQLVGMFGEFSEIRFLPPYGGQRGSLMTVNRRFSNGNMHYLDFNDSPADPPGPDKPGWQAYLGQYEDMWEDEVDETVNISIKNGYLYYGEIRCIEHEPGLFFLYDGEVLDFRSNPPAVANHRLKRKK
ncbi:MAG: beta-lactamase family protein [bacterium]|nr:beta-lactamase family protein [bacterium]